MQPIIQESLGNSQLQRAYSSSLCRWITQTRAGEKDRKYRIVKVQSLSL